VLGAARKVRLSLANPRAAPSIHLLVHINRALPRLQPPSRLRATATVFIEARCFIVESGRVMAMCCSFLEIRFELSLFSPSGIPPLGIVVPSSTEGVELTLVGSVSHPSLLLAFELVVGFCFSLLLVRLCFGPQRQ